MTRASWFSESMSESWTAQGSYTVLDKLTSRYGQCKYSNSNKFIFWTTGCLIQQDQLVMKSRYKACMLQCCYIVVPNILYSKLIFYKSTSYVWICIFPTCKSAPIKWKCWISPGSLWPFPAWPVALMLASCILCGRNVSSTQLSGPIWLNSFPNKPIPSNLFHNKST